MKDEIKEILEDVKRHLDYVETTEQASIRDNEMKVMYDYITNLQEENEILTNARYSLDRVELEDKIKQLEDTIKKLNERISKAIEYIYKDFTHTDEEKDLLNILTGE